MRARKRSGGLVLGLLVLGTGCSAPGAVEDLTILQAWSVTHVADDEAERSEGVRGMPLDPGQSLGFAFPRPYSGGFTMAGVSYPLRLVALDPGGRPEGEWLMEPCVVGPCPRYGVGHEASNWIEYRD